MINTVTRLTVIAADSTVKEPEPNPRLTLLGQKKLFLDFFFAGPKT